MAMSRIFKGFGAAEPAKELAPEEAEALRPASRLQVKQQLKLFENYERSGLGWFWASDEHGRLVYISDAAAEVLRAIGDDLIGRQLSEIFVIERDSEEEEEGSQRPLGFLLTARNKIADLAVRAAVEDKEIWWSITGRPQFGADGEFSGYSGHGKDITAVRQSQRDASRMAQYDSLTGLANRHRMNKRLTATLTAYKAAQRSCALMMLDLDRFKQVNDTLGHPAGDELLKQVAQRLQRVLDKKGEIGRLGGDEFQIILPDIDDRGKLGELAERVIQMISQPYSIEGSRAVIGTSVGIAIAPYDGLDTEDLVRSADLALYAAKGGGRGQHRFYSNDLKDSAKERRQIEEDLRDALARGELQMHYQPVVRAEDNIVAGFEALMRWEHPERGHISPSVFIPIAEESNLITALGEWALRQACKDAAQWPGELRVAVNVSANQFANENLQSVVANALANSGLKPVQLELEITESVFLGDITAANAMFAGLKKIGVRLALDDFGTGYSSLSYLCNAPFDKVKIDQSFVRGSTERENSKSPIISAIVSLAQALGMETTAEGVETLDELELIRAKKASYIQGFIYSRSVSQEEVCAKLGSDDFKYDPIGPSKHRADRHKVYRRIGVIHEDYRYDVVMRNISKSGALIEGLLEVPVGTPLVVDLGDGQLAVGKVSRSRGAIQGVEFETPLIPDGANGLCTRHRVSPYALAAAGMPLAALPPGNYPLVGSGDGKGASGGARFFQVDVSMRGNRAA